MKSLRSLLLILAITACSSASAPVPDPVPVPDARPFAKVYTTSVAGARMAPSQITLGEPSDAHFYKVALNGESYQSVDGFGLAVTQASCFNLLVMNAADRTTFLEEVFSREKGIGSSLIRVCIGGSDFSLD